MLPRTFAGREAARNARNPQQRPKTGKSATWRLNPQVAWKGTGKKHFGALREAQKRGWKLINGEELEQAQDEQQLDLFNDPAPADAAPDRQ